MARVVPIIVVGLFIALVTVPTSANAATPDNLAPNSHARVSVELTEAVSIAEIEKLASKAAGLVSEVRRVFSFGEQEVTVGIPVGLDGLFPTELESVIVAALQGLLGEGTGDRAASDGDFATQIFEAIREVREEGPTFNRFELTNFRDLSLLSPHAQVIVQPDGSSRPGTSQRLLSGSYIPQLVSDYSYGDSIGRYNTLRFRWSSTNLSNLKTSGSGTFEPDFVTYNYDGLHYFGDSIISWSSTMPNAYLDTSILDDPNERVYTIGTQTVSSLIANTTYSTFFRAGFGNSSSDTAKVVWQRGTYLWGCPFGPALCIFADESVIQYAWFPIPGTFTGAV